MRTPGSVGAPGEQSPGATRPAKPLDPAKPLVPTNWVEATIVDIASPSDGSHQVRMKFTERCPFEFFKVAVGGFEVTISDDGR
jgi:hypothetical protein